MEVTLAANYMGQRPSGDYWVNVRTARPSGMIGDAGVIRRFQNEEQAKAYVKLINNTPLTSEQEYKLYQDMFVKEKPEPQQPLNIRHEGDTFVKSATAN
ncbi:hypothetical protein IKP85_07565 [bacterium]|nr:hypothetical protein [bacterium]